LNGKKRRDRILLIREDCGGVATLRLNRPLQFNALASKSLAAIRYGKAMFYRQLQIRLADACAGGVMAHLEQDADEGIAAFVGKRQPTWTS